MLGGRRSKAILLTVDCASRDVAHLRALIDGCLPRQGGKKISLVQLKHNVVILYVCYHLSVFLLAVAMGPQRYHIAQDLQSSYSLTFSLSLGIKMI